MEEYARKAEALRKKSEGSKKLIDDLIKEIEKKHSPNYIEMLENFSALCQHLNDLGEVTLKNFQ